MADTQERFEIAGIPLEGIAAQVGNLIMTNTRYEFALKQLRALHGQKNSVQCMCGELMHKCPSRAVIVAFDALEKEQKR